MDNLFSVLLWVLLVAAVVAVIAGWWKIFEKAGEAGWKSIVPFLNAYTYFRIAGRNGWGFLLMLIPFVNWIVAIVISLDMAAHFGKSGVYGIFALWLFPFIGAIDLGFGDAPYVGTKHV